MPNPFASPAVYEEFVYSLQERYPSCVQEFLNLELGIIEGYGYEVSRPAISPHSPDFPETDEYCRASYSHKEKLYWYDSFPHPHDATLAATDPHHKHIHPDIKHHRVPATELSFTRPNLPYLIREIEQELLTPEYLEARAKRGSCEASEEAVDQVPNAE